MVPILSNILVLDGQGCIQLASVFFCFQIKYFSAVHFCHLFKLNFFKVQESKNHGFQLLGLVATCHLITEAA
uniref:Uncharacterized protein n=1 Tax=Anguilla anguilla TaxID=7936 RepID=A0A0E9WYV9_ANGAN